MKKSMFRWFFVAIFCITFSAGVQASFLDDLKAGKITAEEAIKLAKKLGIPLGDIVRLVVAFSPKKAGGGSNLAAIVKIASKGASASEIRSVVIAAIGTLISGSGVGAIKDTDALAIIAEIATAVKEVASGATEVVNTVVTTTTTTGAAQEETSTSPN